jgi:hypothetical protein
MKSLGLPMAILSNGQHDALQSLVNHAGRASVPSQEQVTCFVELCADVEGNTPFPPGLTGIFDYLLSADSVKRYKTAGEVYSLGPQTFGCPAHEIL